MQTLIKHWDIIGQIFIKYLTTFNLYTYIQTDKNKLESCFATKKTFTKCTSRPLPIQALLVDQPQNKPPHETDKITLTSNESNQHPRNYTQKFIKWYKITQINKENLKTKEYYPKSNHKPHYNPPKRPGNLNTNIKNKK